jgi:predicted acetyltransferase
VSWGLRLEIMNLVKPNLLYKNSFIDAIKEYQTEFRYTDFDLTLPDESLKIYLQKLEDEEKGINLTDGFVPQTTLWLIDNDEFIGRVSIRHFLNDRLKMEGGHVGYDIRPSKRNLGYGTMILKLVIPIARGLGINEIVLTCDDQNIGSWKIIEKNNGKLFDKYTFNGKLKRKYIIK